MAETLSEHTGIWLLLGLLIGWIFRGVIKSAFEKFTGLFWNPIFQPPPLHWKGIDQNLFENPSFKMVTGGLNPSSDVVPTPYKYCSKCGKGRVSARAEGINNTLYGAKGQLDPYKTAQTTEPEKEGMCGCAVNAMRDWDNM